MDRTPEELVDALASEKTDAVNAAIDYVDDLELVEKAGLFDACLERTRELYDDEDTGGYERQAAVRFARALYPRLVLPSVGRGLTDEGIPGEHTVADAARHRRELRDFALDAIVDDDGRVRQAAIKLIDHVATNARLIGADDELRILYNRLSDLVDECGDPQQKHVQQALEKVAFQGGFVA